MNCRSGSGLPTLSWILITELITPSSDIETLPRRGYRFLESVARAPESSASIAVLPFLNLSADPENEYFADGMSEEIINALMQIKHLRVAARTSAFSFKGKHVDLREIG